MNAPASCPLSPYEIRILALCGQGLTAVAVGGRVGRSEFALKADLAKVRRRLGARNTAHAVAIAHQRGLLERDRVPTGKPLVLDRRLSEAFVGIACGLQGREIANRLRLSLDAVKSRIKRLLALTGARNAVQAVHVVFARHFRLDLPRPAVHKPPAVDAGPS